MANRVPGGTLWRVGILLVIILGAAVLSFAGEAYSHEEDDVFFVLEGTMSFFVGGKWIDAPAGSLVIAPGGTAHDFENRTAKRAGALNFSVPGDFEPHMTGIAEWFRARSAAESRTGG